MFGELPQRTASAACRQVRWLHGCALNGKYFDSSYTTSIQ